MRQRILKGGIMHALGLASLAMLLVPNAAHAGHWSFTGTLTDNGILFAGSQPSNGSWSAGAPVMTQYGPGGLTINSTFIYTVAGTWVPDNSGDTSQPPPSILVTATDTASSAAITGQAPGSVTVDDGQSDSQVNSTSYPPHVTVVTGTSAGKHLVPVTGGSFSISVTMTATGSAPSGANGSSGLSIVPDTRAVTISAGTIARVQAKVNGALKFDQYNNPVWTTGPEPTDSGGATAGDIALNYATIPGTSDYPFTYGVSASGPWTFTGGSYNWYSSLTSLDNSGSASSIPGFRVLYDVTGPSGVSEIGSKDHIHLTAIDGSDGTQATANLYMKLHAPIEVTALKGPTSPSDPNYFSYMTYPGTVAGGMAVDGVGSVDYSEYTAVYGVLGTSGAYVTTCAAVVAISDPLLAAIVVVAGYGATSLSLNAAPPAQLLWTKLWPTQVSQWTLPNGAPPDWSPGKSSDQLAAGEASQCVCSSVNLKVSYVNTYYECDQWSGTGYLGPNNYLLGINPGPSPDPGDYTSAVWTYNGAH